MALLVSLQNCRVDIELTDQVLSDMVIETLGFGGINQVKRFFILFEFGDGNTSVKENSDLYYFSQVVKRWG
jgi:hypothetical protein